MKTEQLLIPFKCKVRCQDRNDTFTKKLGYIIYHDGKEWRKEQSWKNWCIFHGDKTLEQQLKENILPLEFENLPTEGFVLNKKVGGNKYSHNPRQTYSRIFDPRGFEFEITVSNLLFILENCNSIKGKALEGKFVYSWFGKELILLPCDSEDYIKSQVFTKLQDGKINAKDLVEGYTYENNLQEQLIYLGKLDYYYDKKVKKEKESYYSEKYDYIRTNKKHFIFYSNNKFIALKSLNNIKKLYSNNIVENYAELIDNYYKTEESSELVNFELFENNLDIDFENKKKYFYYGNRLFKYFDNNLTVFILNKDFDYKIEKYFYYLTKESILNIKNGNLKRVYCNDTINKIIISSIEDLKDYKNCNLVYKNNFKKQINY